MKLEKAIEILNSHAIPLKTAQDHDFFDALKLGIEALKVVTSARANSYWTPIPILPGETTEEETKRR